MSDEVNVKFSGDAAGVEAAADRTKEKVGEVGNSMKELSGELRDFKGLLVEAFSIREMEEFVSRISEIGEQAERMSAMLGMDAQSVQELGFEAKITGGNAEGMAMSLGRFERNAAEAAAGNEKLRQTFANVGITLDDLKTKSPAALLGEVADKFHDTADGANKYAYAVALGGRTWGEMIPQLDKGSEGMREIGIVAEQTGSILDGETAEAFAKTHQNLVVLRASIEGDGIAVFKAFKPVIDDVIQGLTDYTQKVSQGAQQNVVLHAAIVVIAGAFEGFKTMLTDLGIQIGEFFAKMVVEAQTAATVVMRLTKLDFSGAKAAWKDGMDEIDAIIAEANKRRADNFKQAKAAMEAVNYGAPGGGETPAGSKPSLPPIPGSPNTAALSAIEAQQQIAKAHLATMIAILQQEAAYHQLTKQQEIEQEKQAVDQEFAIDRKALEEKAALYAQGSADYQKTLNQMQVLEAQHVAKIAQLDAKMAQANQQAAQQSYRSWQAALRPIEGAFDTMLTGVLQGTQTLSQAMANAFSNMAISVVESILKIIAEWLVFEAVTEGQVSWSDFVAIQGGGGGGNGGFLGSIGKILSFDVGTPYVPSTGLAMIHQGEMIIPAAQAQAIRSGADSGGGANVTFVIQAIDTQTGAQFIKSNAGVIAQAISGQLRNQNSSLSAMARSA